MKAIRVREFGPPEVMILQDISLPQPSPDEILIDVQAIGVNPVDTYIRDGRYGHRDLPFTPGLDAAGVVVQVGQDVAGFMPNQRVYSCGSVSGTYAQQILCKSSQVRPLPDPVSFEQGAALGVPYITAYRGLFQRGCSSKQSGTVMVHGASGGVGIAAVQLAKAAGLKVIGTAGSQQGRQLVAEQGADMVLDHHDPRHFEHAMGFTDGRGVDVVLEMLANVNLGRDLPIMATHGRVVIIGSRGPVEIDPRDAMAKEVSILGELMFHATDDERDAAYTAIEAGLVDGSLNPVIAEKIPLAEAPKAHHRIIESDHHGKILLIP